MPEGLLVKERIRLVMAVSEVSINDGHELIVRRSKVAVRAIVVMIMVGLFKSAVALFRDWECHQWASFDLSRWCW